MPPGPPRAVAADRAVDRPATPWRRGQRVQVTAPDGSRYGVRVEDVATTSQAGVCTLVASIISPRRYRGQLLTGPVVPWGARPAA